MPLPSAVASIDAFLRGEGLYTPERTRERPTWWIPTLILGCCPIYGLAMGSFALESPDRLWMMVFAAIKAPLLLLATTTLCLPPFFVLNNLLGLRGDFREALQAILAGQAGVSVALASCAAFPVLWYLSVDSYRAALLFNTAIFTAAACAGHLAMQRYYRLLIRRDPLHRVALRAWLGLYAFVGIQMGWTLRPFIGSPDMPVGFFRPEPFSNAYVVVWRLIFGID